MIRRKPFPVGAKAQPYPGYDDPIHDAAHRDLMATKYLPRLRQIAAFFDEADRWGWRLEMETLLGIREEMWTLLVLTWAGQSEGGGERMIEENLPALATILDLRERNAARAKAKLEARRAR